MFARMGGPTGVTAGAAMAATAGWEWSCAAVCVRNREHASTTSQAAVRRIRRATGESTVRNIFVSPWLRKRAVEFGRLIIAATAALGKCFERKSSSTS
jgi:hypothetical protein